MNNASYSTKIVANGDTQISITQSGMYEVHASGTFGGGTITIGRQPAGSSNFITAVDSAGNDVTFDAEGIKSLVSLAAGNVNVNMAGATSPSVSITFIRISL
jgi:hypothetical protein